MASAKAVAVGLATLHEAFPTRPVTAQTADAGSPSTRSRLETGSPVRRSDSRASDRTRSATAGSAQQPSTTPLRPSGSEMTSTQDPGDAAGGALRAQ
jgi:hypothetical protein